MDQLLRLWAITLVTVKRMAAQRSMVLATLLGIIAAVAISMSIPLYADAAYQKIYSTTFTQSTVPGTLEGSHPPYALMYRYVGAWSGTLSYDDIAAADSYLSSGSIPFDIGLPNQLFVRYLQSDAFQLFPPSVSSYANNIHDSLEYVNFATLDGANSRLELVSGSLPSTQVAPAGEPVEVLVSQNLAARTGIQAGDTYTAYEEITVDDVRRPIQIPVRVSGIWKAKDPLDPFWFYGESGFEKVLLLPEASLLQRVYSNAPRPVNMAVWYWVLDGSRVHSNQVPELLQKLDNTRKFAEALLPNISLEISPEDILQRFQRSAQSLTLYLYAFCVPLLLMIMIFIGLVVDMVVAQRRNEIAVMRSRGASVLQVMVMAVLESLLLGVVGVIISAPASQVIATVFTRAVSFLNFSGPANITVDFTAEGLKLGLVAMFIAALAQVLPTLGAARHTIITYKQERSRASRPWWQRYYLDVALLVPSAYGFFTMQVQGGITLPGASSALVNDPFQNPFLLLVPALGIFSLALILIRFLPRVMNFIAGLAERTSSVGVLMAARYLGRASGGYNAPLILLVVTLSLSTFTASLAQTLDRHINDQTYYQVGGDMSVTETGEYTGQVSSPYAPIPQQPVSSEPARWLFLPVSDHLKIPGVEAAARIGRFNVSLNATRGRIGVTYVGIDRFDFSQVAFWRRDFADRPLGELMNDLALQPDGVLVNADYLAQNGLQVGNVIRITGAEVGQTFAMQFKIVGTLNYFPTWYPASGPLIVGNLDYFFEQAGGEFPYDVWLKVAPNTDYAALTRGITAMFGRLLDSGIASQDLATAMALPERQGFFGLLSVGFAALAVLTVLGFLLYALFSFRQRFVELGMLRAIGLSTRQMLVFLTSELAFLFVVGLGAGTGLGVWVSNLFIPQLQVGNKLAARIPPFLVRIDWPSVFQIYYLFAALFVVALLVLFFMLGRMKIFQAVKMGESV